MKCISMILTSNCSELCIRSVLNKKLVFQGRKVKNFGMASARAFLRREKFEKELLLQFLPNEMYFYDINIKLF